MKSAYKRGGSRKNPATMFSDFSARSATMESGGNSYKKNLLPPQSFPSRVQTKLARCKGATHGLSRSTTYFRFALLDGRGKYLCSTEDSGPLYGTGYRALHPLDPQTLTGEDRSIKFLAKSQ